MIKGKIRVLMIEDSKLYQVYLRKVIESDPCLEVAGTADCGSSALQLIGELKPDIITLDLLLPDADGLELLAEIIHRWNIPVIVVSGDAGSCEKAIEIGARDFIEKMQDADVKTAEQFQLLLKLKIKMQAEIHAEYGIRPPLPVVNPPVSPRRTDAAGRGEMIIAIGASLGGTETTLQLLQKLPADIPGIVIVQHLPAEFTKAYAMRLNNFCSLTVREARNGDSVQRGCALVAKGGEQMSVYRAEDGYRVRVGGTEKSGGFCPSVDVLFRSVAAAAGSAALGILLTGMGKDGAAGIKCMHDGGAYTLGQNRESCAVFGMPGAAWELGALDKLLSPENIAKEIIRSSLRYKKSEAEKNE